MEQDYIHSIINKYEEDLQKVKQNGWHLELVKEQTYELCLEAVKQHGWTLKIVKEQTPEICWEAVKQAGHALYWQLLKDNHMNSGVWQQ
jgi:hypothetical protein